MSKNECNDFIKDYWDYEERKLQQKKEAEKEEGKKNRSVEKPKSNQYDTLFPTGNDVNSLYVPSKELLDLYGE